MSEENVEIVKRVTDAFNRRDVDAVLDFCASDCVVSSQLLDVSADFRGREGLERFYGMLGESWDGFCSVVDDYRDLGDRVLVLGRNQGRGTGSGVSIDGPMGAVFDFWDGNVSRIRLYLDHGEALRAAGISE
jgi:ketosteroid isomerase-like protein